MEWRNPLSKILPLRDRRVKRRGSFTPIREIGTHQLEVMNARIDELGLMLQAASEQVESQVQAQLEQLEKYGVLHNNLIEFMPCIVWICAPTGEMMRCNSQWTEFTGLTLEQTRATNGVGVIYENDKPRLDSEWAKALVTGADFQLTFRMRRARDGKLCWFMSNGRASKDKDGKILEWIGTLQDISQMMD